MIYIGPLRANSALAEPVKALLDSDGGPQKAISFMRQQGESKIGSIRALVVFGSFALADAKRLVHCSETWRDYRDADDAFHTSLAETFHAVDALQTNTLECLPEPA